MRVQRSLGSDVVMAFDECTPYPATERQARESMELSMRWAARSKAAHGESAHALFGIVQGGVFSELRQRSLDELTSIGFDGYAIGGLAVGEPNDERLHVLDHLTHRMPSDATRYLMGVGTPYDLVEGIARGVDLFDCVMPSAMRATDTYSPAKVWSGFAMQFTARTTDRSTPSVHVRPAPTTLAPIFII